MIGSLRCRELQQARQHNPAETGCELDSVSCQVKGQHRLLWVITRISALLFIVNIGDYFSTCISENRNKESPLDRESRPFNVVMAAGRSEKQCKSSNYR